MCVRNISPGSVTTSTSNRAITYPYLIRRCGLCVITYSCGIGVITSITCIISKAIFLLPVVFIYRDCHPEAVLVFPVVFLNRAICPEAAFCTPVVFEYRALYPAAVLIATPYHWATMESIQRDT